MEKGFRASVDCRWSLVGLSYERGTGRGVRGRGPRRCRRCSTWPPPNERERRAASCCKLRLAHQWAVLHPATSRDRGRDPRRPRPRRAHHRGVPRRRRHPGGGRVHPRGLRPELGISPAAGAQLIGDALDLRHRLPLLWKRVTRLQVPAWQARRVAQQTHRLPLVGARWVDQRLASRTDGALRPGHHRPAGRPRRRQVRPRGTRATRGQRHRRLGGQAQPPRPDLLRRHLRPGRHRRHPDPAGLLRPGLRHRPPALARRRHRPARSPQDQGHRPDHRPRHRPGRPRPRSRCSAPRSTKPAGKIKLYVRVDADDLDVDATRRRRVRRPAGRDASAPPPWPSSATGSATTRSSSNRS